MAKYLYGFLNKNIQNLPGTKIIFVLVVWTMMMPGQIRMVPNYISYLHFPFAFDWGMGVSLLDTFWPMWLGAGADTFAVLLFKNAFDALSNSYVEAAKIDGCSDFGIFNFLSSFFNEMYKKNFFFLFKYPTSYRMLLYPYHVSL